MTAIIKLLSAGAVKPGLMKVIESFQSAGGHDVTIGFATAPEIRRRLQEGEAADIVIAPNDLVDALMMKGQVASADRAVIGRIGVGVMVREDLPAPQIATVEAFQTSLLNAESIVYNQASTGTYIDSLFDRLGIAAQMKTKTTRYADFAAVLEHIRRDRSSELGLGATTVIIENANRGIKFIGPLPAEIQNYTTYAAAVATHRIAGDGASALLRFLTSASAKHLFTAAGIE